MIESPLNSTSSVGAVWPPKPSSNNRLRGFYGAVVDSSEEVRDLANNFTEFSTEAVADPNISRLSIRAVTSIRALGELSNLGIPLEGSLPIKDSSDLVVAYTAWNDPNRTTSSQKLAQHIDLLEATVVQPCVSTGTHNSVEAQGYSLQIINRSTSDRQKRSLVGKFRDLYGVFGYNQEEVEQILLNPDNTIAYIEDGSGVVSTAMAEHASLPIEGYGELTMTEVTEAITRPSHRRRGLYEAVSQYLVHNLTIDQFKLPNIIYGEGNLTMKGVIIAAHNNGRQFSFFDRQRLNITQPAFGILQQNVHILDGTEDRPFNDFALSYVPL